MSTLSKKHLIGAIVAVALAGTTALTGCGSSDADAGAGSSPNGSGGLSTVSTDPTPVADETPAAPQSAADLVLVPGAAGPVKVGMSKAEALATGLIDADVATGSEACPTDALGWKPGFAGVLDIQALKSGEVASIGVRKAGPKTEAGLGLGSTMADVLAAYPGSKAVAAGYGQTGVLVHDNATDGWIGFLFDAAPKKVQDSSPVTFIELTQGEKPSLMRDGC